MKGHLTHENFLLYCAAHYENVRYDSEEFLEDLNRIKYIKKLITRYVQSKDLKERLILNHVIVLNNCFGPEMTARILYLKLREQMEYVKPFLILINAMPRTIREVGGETSIDTTLIGMDQEIVHRLRKI